jgi:hypothetical protein
MNGYFCSAHTFGAQILDLDLRRVESEKRGRTKSRKKKSQEKIFHYAHLLRNLM